MAWFLAVFNLFAGTCSVLGVLVPAITGENLFPAYILAPAFLATAIVSAYILFVPGTRIERNVRGKIERYHAPPKSLEAGSPILIQRGTVTLAYKRSPSIEFPLPYATTPEVEVLNTYGHDDVAEVETVTPHQAVFRGTSGSYGPFAYSWVARGAPLEPIA